MRKSVFHISQMDCPTEEQLIRKRLERVPGIEALQFNLLDRELSVHHTLPDDGPLLAALQELGMELRASAADTLRTDRFVASGMC